MRLKDETIKKYYVYYLPNRDGQYGTRLPTQYRTSFLYKINNLNRNREKKKVTLSSQLMKKCTSCGKKTFRPFEGADGLKYMKCIKCNYINNACYERYFPSYR